MEKLTVYKNNGEKEEDDVIRIFTSKQIMNFTISVVKHLCLYKK